MSYLDYEPIDDEVLNYCKYVHYEESNPNLPQCSNELFLESLKDLSNEEREVDNDCVE